MNFRIKACVTFCLSIISLSQSTNKVFEARIFWNERIFKVVTVRRKKLSQEGSTPLSIQRSRPRESESIKCVVSRSFFYALRSVYGAYPAGYALYTLLAVVFIYCQVENLVL
jgi:hypothetical protein